MPTTPTHALPYPSLSDSADVPRDIQALAVKLDGLAGLAPPPALVSALPGSPADGQEVYYQNAGMASAGVIWQLRYRSGAAGSYKWEFVGGAPLESVGLASESTTATTPNDLSTLVAVTLPLAGDYDIAHGCPKLAINGSSGSTLITTMLEVGGVAWNEVELNVHMPYAGVTMPAATQRRFTGAAVGTVVKQRGKTNVYTATWQHRWLRAVPVRVG